MSTPHKPSAAPWQAGLDMPEVANNNPDKRLVWSGSMVIADCRSQWISQEQAEANAQLMAAAPTLLAACQAFAKWFDGWCPTATCCARSGLPIHEQALAAIAKAVKKEAMS